jgi:Ca2+-binding RTX toxin-like protein
VGSDRLEGRGEWDRLDGGPGADVLVGGSGRDVVGYAFRTRPVSADLDGLADDGEAGEGDRVARDVEDLWGGSANDRLTGDDRGNLLVGGLGADVLRTGASRGIWETVHADEFRCSGSAGGGDVVVAGRGEPTVFGCGGDDIIRLGPGSGDVEGGPGRDRIFGGPGGDGLRGNRGSDVIFGRGGREFVDGGSGDDRLVGGAGDDHVEGSYGDDAVFGGPGRDRLFGDREFGGGRGDDVLYACDGERDRLSGGRGRDRARTDRLDRVRSAVAVRCGFPDLAGKKRSGHLPR